MIESGIKAWIVGGQAALGFGGLGADALCVDIRVSPAEHAQALELLDKHYAKTSQAPLDAAP